MGIYVKYLRQWYHGEFNWIPACLRNAYLMQLIKIIAARQSF